MTTDAERRAATDQWTIQLREQQLRDLREQLATAQQRDEQRRVLLDDAQVLARDAQRRAADAEIALSAANTETTEQAWEIAGLRYYVEALERRLPPAQRQAAADEASAALALHNPPASGRHRDRDGMVSATIGKETDDDSHR